MKRYIVIGLTLLILLLSACARQEAAPAVELPDEPEKITEIQPEAAKQEKTADEISEQPQTAQPADHSEEPAVEDKSPEQSEDTSDEPEAVTPPEKTEPTEQDKALSEEPQASDPLDEKEEETPAPEPEPEPKNTDSPAPAGSGIKAIWLTQYDLNAVYTANGSQRSQSDFTSRIKGILSNIQNLGFNTVFLQIRPNGDSMYPSDYFPMSKYVVGKAGVSAQYDPVSTIVDEAHTLGLEVHAWINPLRVMAASELDSVSDSYLTKTWYADGSGTKLVQSGNYYYLNPAYEDVRNLIADGAKEALTRYPFDGLHIDDYFYPTTDTAFDAEAYAAYQSGGGSATLANFRRDNINKLVSALHATAASAGVPFGVSPAGNMKTVYESQYADIYTWCSDAGYIDYICPQVYFGLEHATMDFVSVCNAYEKIITNNHVDLLIGMTLGKAYEGIDNWAGSGKHEWSEHKDILARCLAETEKLSHCSGIAVFSYQYFYDPLTGTAVAQTAQECAAFIPLLQEATW